MDNIYKQATQLQFKLRDYLDQPNHAAATQLSNEVQRLTDEIESKKNPRSLEDRVKTIIRQLEVAERAQVLDDNHADDLRDRCEDLRQDLRKLS